MACIGEFIGVDIIVNPSEKVISFFQLYFQTLQVSGRFPQSQLSSTILSTGGWEKSKNSAPSNIIIIYVY